MDLDDGKKGVASIVGGYAAGMRGSNVRFSCS